jgi:hypothetical protein
MGKAPLGFELATAEKNRDDMTTKQQQARSKRRRANPYSDEDLSVLKESLGSVGKHGDDDRTVYQIMIDALATVTPQKKTKE